MNIINKFPLFPDPADIGALPTSGGTMAGAIDMDGNAITGLPEPENGGDAVSKDYADNRPPASHADSHSAEGDDPVTPTGIGAVDDQGGAVTTQKNTDSASVVLAPADNIAAALIADTDAIILYWEQTEEESQIELMLDHNADLDSALSILKNRVSYKIYGEHNKPTAADVGLGNVDNTSDASKPISTATQTALDAKVPTSRTVNSKALSANITLTTADIADSTDKRYVTDAQKTVIGNTSGTNTGDETESSIKTKLGITTLSGVNTGDQDLSGYALKPTITVNANAAPALGALTHNSEYRCTNAAITTAPTMTIPAIASTATEFVAAVIYKSPGTTAPAVTNNSGYTLKYSGADVTSGTWTPVAGTVYRISLVFDGIYLNAYITGVA